MARQRLWQFAKAQFNLTNPYDRYRLPLYAGYVTVVCSYVYLQFYGRVHIRRLENALSEGYPPPSGELPRR